MAQSATEPAETGVDLVPSPYAATDLTAPLAYHDVDANRLALIKAQVAPNCADHEVAHFLELCHHYGLDPFAREAWCAKGNGKLLIMVGRDGLRKIVQRQGLRMDGDVVHENDNIEVTRAPDGSRTVAHTYGHPAKRGDITGAWAEVRNRHGRQLGYFYAPLSEYMPAGVSSYSPWSKQTSVMILAAAERQAARQATPLSGLLAEGEDEVINGTAQALGQGVGDGQPVGLALGDDVEAVIARAEELGHAAFSESARAMIEMQLTDGDGQVIPARAAAWVKTATVELDAIPPDAEVIDGEPVSGAVRHSDAQATEHPPEATDGPEAPRAAGEPGEYAPPTEAEQAVADKLGQPIVSQGFLDDGPPRKAEPQAAPDPKRIAALRQRGEALLADAEALQDEGDPRAAEVFEEADQIMATVEAMGDPSQERLAI